jgi:hypothetical protein
MEKERLPVLLVTAKDHGQMVFFITSAGDAVGVVNFNVQTVMVLVRLR